MSIHSNDSHQVSRREKGYVLSHRLQLLQISLQKNSDLRGTAAIDYDLDSIISSLELCPEAAGCESRWMIFLPFEWQIREMALSFNLMDHLRSNVWVSHSSFLAADKDGNLFCVLCRSLPVLCQICEQPFWLQSVRFTLWVSVCMGGWLKGLPFRSPTEIRWKDCIFYGWSSPESFKVESLCCQRNFQQLHRKVNNSNSISHSLHGCKINILFIEGIQ